MISFHAAEKGWLKRSRRRRFWSHEGHEGHDIHDGHENDMQRLSGKVLPDVAQFETDAARSRLLVCGRLQLKIVPC